MLLYLEKLFDIFSRPKIYLIWVNISLVSLLILLSNSRVLPVQKIQDFVFFAIIFLIFALYRPGWAFLFFVGTVALENINLAPDALKITIRPYQFIGGLAILALIIRAIFKRADFDLPKWKMIDWAVIVFALAGFLSAVSALDRGASFKQSVIALSFAALYFLVRVFIQNRDDLKRIIPFFFSSSAVIVLYGIWQNIRFAQDLNSFAAMPGRPNATFTEADWLGIYLVLLIAVLYAVIYYFYNVRDNKKSLISNDQFPTRLPDGQVSNQFPISFKIQNLSLISLYIILATSYILLILTVSRSAWLGAAAVTIAYLLAIFTQLKLNPKAWIWKKTLQIKIGILIALAVAIGVVYFFHLTTFQLWSRIQSTGLGLQRITISCVQNTALPDKINFITDLEQYNCRHINLEEISAEKEAGNFVKEINRPDPNVNIRAQIYQKSWGTIKAHPILGIGWGNSSLVLGHDERGVALNSSNLFLETWLGSGILGLLVLVCTFLYIFIKGLINFRTGNGEGKIIGLFIVLGTVALLIPNLFNAGIFLGFFWVFLGVSTAESDSYKSHI